MSSSFKQRHVVLNISYDANNTSMLTLAMQIRNDVRKYEDVHDSIKLRVRQSEPYTIEHSHANDTLTIQLRTGSSKRINMQRIVLYR